MNIVESEKAENIVAGNPFAAGYIVESEEPFFSVLNRLFALTNGRVKIVKRCKSDEKKDGKLYVINNMNLLFGNLGPVEMGSKTEKEIKIEIKNMGDKLLVELSEESKKFSKDYEEGKLWTIRFFVGRLIVLVETD